jgi:hypothetical protein
MASKGTESQCAVSMSPWMEVPQQKEITNQDEDS